MKSISSFLIRIHCDHLERIICTLRNKERSDQSFIICDIKHLSDKSRIILGCNLWVKVIIVIKVQKYIAKNKQRGLVVNYCQIISE